MKSLRKRALAISVGKRYKNNKMGGFDIFDEYGSVGFAHKISDKFLIELITLRPVFAQNQREE